MHTIGFIGLGKIGMPAARNLIEKGMSVVGYRRSSMTDFEAIGGKPARSPADVGLQADVVLACLPDDGALEEVMVGPGGLIQSARPGQVVVELGSHPVAVKERYVAMLAEKGAVFLDGEVSGTPGMVAARKAFLYLAGDADASDRAEPAMRAISDLYLYMGAFGSATRIKLVANVLVASNIAATAQAMALGLQLGINPDMLIEAISKSAGGSLQFNIRAPWMADRAFVPQQGSAKALHHYLNGAKRAAKDVGVGTTLIDSLIDLYATAIPGIDDRDVAALVEHFEPQN